MTTDEEVRLALRWSIGNATGDQFTTTAMDWTDKGKVSIRLFLSLRFKLFVVLD